MSVIQDVFDVMVFIVLLVSVVWYVLFARSYLTDLTNWGFRDNDDKTAQLISTSDDILYDDGRMSKAELLLSAYVWDTKSLAVNSINYSTAHVVMNSGVGSSNVLMVTPCKTLVIDPDFRAVKMSKVKDLATLIISPTVTGDKFSVMYVPDADVGTSLMYLYTDKGLSNFNIQLKTSIGGNILDASTKTNGVGMSANFGGQGDSVSGTGVAVTPITGHWEVIIN